MSNLPCLPLIQERFWNEIKSNFKNQRLYPEFNITMFQQIWGSTALGFDGIGGQAITKAYTVVVQEVKTGWCGVFFNERIAYTIYNPNQTFFDDLKNRAMKPVYEAETYKKLNG